MDKIKTFFREKWHILVLVALAILVSYPALFMEMAKGHDLDFHLMRAEGLLNDARWGNLPVRMQSPWIEGYGYPVSILYGDLFLYPLALFRAAGLAIMPAFRIFVLCLNIATVAVAYGSFKVIFKKKETALFSTVLYVTAAYRLVDEYVRSAMGETLAITWLPAVAACIYVILSSDDDKGRRKASVVLALAFTAVTCSHTQSTTMTVFILTPAFFIGLFLFSKKGTRLKRFINVVSAAVIMAALSAFFVVPFADFFTKADIDFAFEYNVSIQAVGLKVYDMFDFFVNPYRTPQADNQKTPGIALMAVLVLALIYIIISIVKKKFAANHKRIVFEAAFAILVLFITTRYFPWNFVEKNVPMGDLFTAIEYPMRYLPLAIIFLALLAGDMFELLTDLVSADGQDKRGRKIITSVFVIAGAMCIFNVVNLCVYTPQFEKRALYMTREDLGRWDYYAMDFQLENCTVDEVDTEVRHEGMLSIETLSRQSNDWLIACVTGPDYGWIQLPMFAYPYYYAHDVEDPSKVFEIHEGANRTVGVLLPGNYSGIVHVYWKEPMFWEICEWISLAAFIACMAYLLSGAVRRRRDGEE